MWIWALTALVLGFIILPICQGSFTTGNIAFIIYSSIIPAAWIELCRFWSKRNKKRLKIVEEQLNTPCSAPEQAGT